jgi:bifunctional UDP-N-acetylglucosamine pyrophosphorylase/glucosamine-1-phosphate N-acetyltransferase/UDP-N-acetylglucosamine pyrophosphorylase
MSEPLAIVLAAGKGTRMKSDLPEVLFPVCGRPRVRYVLEALHGAGVGRVLVVAGYKADLVRRELSDEPGVEFVVQSEQLGTGHAVMMCRKSLAEHDGPVLILAGDSPMTQVSSLKLLLEDYGREQPACLLGTAMKEDPTGLGRIMRDNDGQFVGIVEEKDATAEQKTISEVNMSTYLFDSQSLLVALEQLTTDNLQGEYYVTDCPRILKQEGKQVSVACVLQPQEALSINTLEDLAVVEAAME